MEGLGAVYKNLYRLVKLSLPEVYFELSYIPHLTKRYSLHKMSMKPLYGLGVFSYICFSTNLAHDIIIHFAITG